MNYIFIPDSISFFLLCSCCILLWRQRKHFHSLVPVALAVMCLSLGRIVDVCLELSIVHSSFSSGWKHESFDLLMTNTGNTCDLLGILLLIYGFLKTIEFQKKKEKQIQDLETLLPLCAWCKKYRSENGVWKPIEEYLRDSGAPKVTHGICPECATREMNALEQKS